MGYCQYSDLKNVVPETAIQQLTDDVGLGQVNMPVVNESLAFADETIDGYLRGRYSLPLQETPTMLKKIAAILARYDLYTRRPEVEPPAAVSESFESSIKTLKAIQGGTITLGVQGTGASIAPATTGDYTTNKSSEDRVFSDTELAKF
jgi:phage gp36-like protein